MRLLITGGAGTLGAALVEHLAPRAEAVLCIDNFATGRAENVPEGWNGTRLTAGDVADRAFVDQVFDAFRPDVVIHAAASYKDPDDWATDAAVNVGGSVNVAQAADRIGARRLINLQTVLCYGRAAVSPIPETLPAAPFTSYGISKTAGETYMSLARTPFTSLRLANVAGPRLSIGPIPAFYKRLKTGQPCTCTDAVRDFLHMDDFLSAMDAVLAPNAPSGVFNISGGQGRSIAQVYDQVAKCLGIDAPPAAIVPAGDDDVREVVPSPDKAARLLNWRARRSFEETVADTIAWYDRFGVTAVHSHLKPVEAKP